MRMRKRRCKMLLKEIYYKQLKEANFALAGDGLVLLLKVVKL